MQQPQIAQHSFDADTCTLNNGVIVYDLAAWRAAWPSYTDLLFDWSIANSATKLYSLGSQPPFNLVVRPYIHLNASDAVLRLSMPNWCDFVVETKRF